MSIKDDILKKFIEMPEKRKRTIIFGLIGVLIITWGLFFYKENKKVSKKNANSDIKFKEVVPEVNLLQKSLYQEVIKKNRKIESVLNNLKLELHETKGEINKIKKTKQKEKEEIEKKIQQLMEMNKKSNISSVRTLKNSFRYKENKSKISSIDSYLEQQNKNKKRERNNWVGGILEITNEENSQKETKQTKQTSKKETEKSLYLPPSFVTGDLLNGFAAFVSNQGRKEPVRTIIRLNNLAILPNEIKADLKGCFVIGEAYGDLSDERAHVRLLRLSCIARDGSSVIDSPVEGWVVDSDGNIGLKGTVVAKFGPFMLRYFLAGFLQGFGDAYASSNTAIDLSNGGIQQLPNPGNAAKAGVGKGLGNVGKGLANFYLELAKQTLPVIEVGAGKKITIVFAKGTNLKIKETCVNGRNGCIEKKHKDGYGILSQIG